MEEWETGAARQFFRHRQLPDGGRAVDEDESHSESLSQMSPVKPSERDIPIQSRVAAYRAERDTLLRRVQQALERDPRVAAAWLFGSLGRGSEDALSDLDLF